MGDGSEEHAGTNLYTEDQTEVYAAPPIVNGRVPKNSYGNLDIYVPSMVPPGGAHIPRTFSFLLCHKPTFTKSPKQKTKPPAQPAF
jgi:hypothetical protein